LKKQVNSTTNHEKKHANQSLFKYKGETKARKIQMPYIKIDDKPASHSL